MTSISKETEGSDLILMILNPLSSHIFVILVDLK